MNVLDENIPKPQRQLLERWRVHVSQIGFNIGRRGMHDDAIVPFLLCQHRPTLFTRDADFFDRRLCHPDYAIVYLDVDKYETAVFVRRVLRHPALDTRAKRLGTVIRASSAGLSVWRIRAKTAEQLDWATEGPPARRRRSE